MGRFSMLDYIILTLVVGVPLILNWVILFRRFKSGWFLLSIILFTVSFVITDIFVVRWSWYSYWALFIVLAFTALTVLSGLFKFKHVKWKRPHFLFMMSAVFLFMGAVYFSVFNFTAIRAILTPAGAADIHFPMRHGTFAVTQGGGGAPLQSDHLEIKSQTYAVDLVAINEEGVSASRYLDRQTEGMITLGMPVYAPCSGTIVWAENTAGRDTENHGAGNGAAIKCDQALIFLAHLQKGSIEVRKGQNVKAGALIGRIGNSGHNGPVHLHIHAENGDYKGFKSDNDPVPLTFDGAFLWKNRVISH